MGKDCGTWTPQPHVDWQSPNLRSSFGAPLDVGKQKDVSAATNSGINMNMRNETWPAYASSVLPHPQLGHSNPPHGWFYCLPRFRQEFIPARNFATHENLPASHAKGLKEEIFLNGESGFPQKKFLVIDQSGDKTTLIYSSRFDQSPVDCLDYWGSRLHDSNNLNGNEASLRGDLNQGVGPTLADKVDESPGTDTESEMHEDTEEINALLYSDSDGYSTEEDEVTSTGHSPSTMTTHDNQDRISGNAEEVASSAGKTKKRKLTDGAYDDHMHLMDTASSLNLNRPFEMDDDDDAESRCSSGNNSQGLIDEIGSFSGNKRMRKEKIQDLLSILQSMIPGGKEMEPMELLDEAIQCLKSMKLKVKSLGLDALLS